MNRYKVRATRKEYYYSIVEAETPEQAQAKAALMDDPYGWQHEEFCDDFQIEEEVESAS